MSNLWDSTNLILLSVPQPSLWIGLLGGNIVLSIALAGITAFYLKSPLVNNPFWLWALLSCDGIFIPGLGILLIVLFAVMLHLYGKSAVEIHTISQADYTKTKPIRTIAYAAGWARVRLESDHFNKLERQQALRSISKGSGRDTNIIFKKLLSDKTDELRLYAFGLLENQQDFINRKINVLLRQLKKELPFMRRAKIQKELAQSYWQMVYLNLVGEELAPFIINKSREFVSQALESNPCDAALWVLLAKIYLAQGLPEKAVESLFEADKLGATASATYPYIAEYYFKMRDFKKVRQYLSADISLKNIPTFGKIVEFWCRHE